MGAQSSSPDSSPHLLLVPDTPRAGAALDASSARTVASYDAFTLVEARGEDDVDLRAAGADRRDDMRRVSLPGGEFDPLRGRDSLAARGAPDVDETLAVIQFNGPVKDGWLARLRASGVRIVQYVPQNGYLVHASGAEVDRLAGLVGTDTAVRAVTRVTAADKLSEEVARDGDVRRVAVQTLTGADGADARLDAAAAGPSMRGSSTVGALATQYLTLSAAEREAVANDPAVVSISGYSRPRPLDERSAQIVAGNLLGGTPTGGGDYLNWLDSQGFGTGTLDFAIDIADSGVDTGSVTPMHPDFYENGVRPGTGSRIAYTHNFTADSNARDCIGHGSNVASIAGGYSVAGASRQDADLFRYGLGAAPQVKIGISKFFNCAGSFQFSTGGFDALADTAYAGGARISNHSWGNLDYGAYSADSQLFDSIVRDAQPAQSGNQQMVEVLAAGNEADGLEDQPQAFPDEGWGSVASPGTAKNVITVGASESRRPLNAITCGLDDGAANDADDIASFSSRGPTDDGRLKPDLVAPGTRITGAAPQIGAAYTGTSVCQKFFPSGNTLYNLQSGTSQAAPAVSGAAALVRDWYTREHGQAPSPALTKAILINTATDLVGGEDGRGDDVGPAPNVDQGWGRPHLGAVLDGTQRSYVDQGSVLGNTGARFARSYAVADSTRPLKVTLAWTDAPGMVSTEAFVNDLDLVVRQGGRTYKGNVLAGGRSITGGDADRRNNLESVVLPAGAQGPFSAEVLGTNVAGNGVPGVGDTTDQDFALVVSNGHEQAAPVLAPNSATVHDPAPGDADNRLEPSEPFTLDVAVANGGDAAATDVEGTISGPGLTFSDNSTSWGDIGAGDVEGSESPVAGTLSTGSECGVDVEATLALTSGQGNQTVPVIVPTGQPGLPENFPSPSTQHPAIPDNNPTGALATMVVGTQARIKDLDVRVNISHEWVGDLVIELTSPQGTTVRLADHPGGPDNGGQNLTNTVFDDEATTNISAGAAPYSGGFRPQADQLSRFDGQRLNGNWTLRVRDLFEGKTGTVNSWGLAPRRALCDFDGSVLADTTPPDTQVTAGPSGTRASQAASFSFAANEPDVTFECGLDGGAFTPCDSTHSVGGLPEGPHTLRVRARDPANNVDPSPAESHWTVDVSGPALSIGRPNAGDSLTDSTPPIAGTAGVAPGDTGTVNVNLWRGSQPSGLPAQTLVVPRNAASGAWSVTPSPLSDGTWTARVQQSDAAGNTGFSQPRTFSVDTTAPEFAIAPVEANRADVLKGRLTVLAGCGTTCGVTAELRSAGRRPTVLGRASTTVGRNSNGTLRVRLTKKGRAAVRNAKKANLTATVTVGARSRVVLKQPVTFRKLNLPRVARRGLSFAGQCAEQCSLSARLLMRASDAKRYGLRPPSSAPVPVAGGNASSAARTTLLTLRPNKASRPALRRARRLTMTFEAVVRASSGPSHRATYPLTLRR